MVTAQMKMENMGIVENTLRGDDTFNDCWKMVQIVALELFSVFQRRVFEKIISVILVLQIVKYKQTFFYFRKNINVGGWSIHS
jgi:hypothetical protein